MPKKPIETRFTVKGDIFRFSENLKFSYPSRGIEYAEKHFTLDKAVFDKKAEITKEIIDYWLNDDGITYFFCLNTNILVSKKLKSFCFH